MANENIFYRPLTPADEKQARVVAYSYHREDPICRDLNIIVPDEVDPNINSSLCAALASGLSIGAFDRSSNNRMIGAQNCIRESRAEEEVSGVAKTPMYDVTDPIQWKFAKDEMIMMTLHNNTFTGSVFDYLNTDSLAHLFDLAVIPEYQGMGIGTRLVQEAISVASETNFSHMTAEASSIFSRRIFDKLGFDNHNCVTYLECKKNGFTFLSDNTIKVHVGMSLHVLALKR